MPQIPQIQPSTYTCVVSLISSTSGKKVLGCFPTFSSKTHRVQPPSISKTYHVNQLTRFEFEFPPSKIELMPINSLCLVLNPWAARYPQSGSLLKFKSKIDLGRIGIKNIYLPCKHSSMASTSSSICLGFIKAARALEDIRPCCSSLLKHPLQTLSSRVSWSARG